MDQARDANPVSMTPFQSQNPPQAWTPASNMGDVRPAPNREEGKFTEYVTRFGDTLPAISKHFYGTPDYYLDIYLANRDKLRNPAQVPAGIALKIPVYE